MLSRRNRVRVQRGLSLVIAALIVNLIIPTPTRTASAAEIETQTTTPAPLTSSITFTPQPIEGLGLPTIPNKPRPEAKQHLFVRSSAYSSTPDQTDGSPFITASGSHVHFGTVAANCLPIGTKIRIPAAFGDTIFTVEDRMNPRWGCDKIDIWMNSRAEAIQWGIPHIQIEILET